LAVVLDVVYNHLGPEGNYLAEFGHYFTDRHRTPWGMAMNVDSRHSDEIRRFFIENALFWIEDCHIDALRLDAVHAIFDYSARPFLRELADAVRLQGERLNRRVYTIAESNLNDPRLIRSTETGGFGIDAQWCDDFHHALRTTLTSDQGGYFADFHGFDDLVKAYRDGFVQDGRESQYRGRRHGTSSRDIPPLRLVVCSQNHDQVGNRMFGERLSQLVSFEQLKLAAAAVLLSPFQPLLFMGEEYGETAPFQYFVSHLDPALHEAVREGRKQEFASFAWNQSPPDPQDEATFLRSHLNHDLKDEGKHQVLRRFYQAVIRLRHSHSSLLLPSRERIDIEVLEPGRSMAIRSWTAWEELLVMLHFGPSEVEVAIACPGGSWTKLLDSAERAWNGPGSTCPSEIAATDEGKLTLPPHSAVVYLRHGCS
jgi:maltooligosyltrehalose trehalohydrolase